MGDVMQFVYFLGALIVSLTVHEAAHAVVAYYLGDPTAKMQGRVTLNPLKHLDPVGSIVFLITQQIGWGRPVPVDPRYFQHPVRDNALVALAGPVSNFLLAFAVAVPLKYLGGYMPGFLLMVLWMMFNVNVSLGLFNLFPFPPLDGSKVIGVFVPKKYHGLYEDYLENGVKYFIAIILIDAFILRNYFGFSLFGSAMRYMYDVVSTILLLGT